MDAVVFNVPRFRSTSRLAQWVRKTKPNGRLPRESERCFFRTRESPGRVSKNLLYYSNYAGELGSELDALFQESELPQYVRILHAKGFRPSNDILCRLKEEQLIWVSNFIGKLPDEMERRISSPSGMVDYAQNVGLLEPHLEEVIEQDPGAVARYIMVLKTHFKEVPERFLRALVGHDCYFSSLVKAIGRLPSYLEESITDPRVALDYARNVVRGRLPESVELCLQKDHSIAVRYAFDIVRGYASVQLPDAVHSSLVMKSFESPDDHEIRRYFAEIDRISEKPGSAGG